ncbi:MAG TPA: FecR domain-containing protein [Bosea sp. (in: a-proteobacteria)]|jgi:transmembrane sensor|uniref:FecR family protein n=1 Tax=Bosea sp. (in: a-proteobacteria) TaxID=1871050 RepID=UPI002E121FC7|nr:FecR domain-containing protein [Bosea sp. (in: a-proteobacteria)]
MSSEDTHQPDEALLERQSIAWFTRMNGRPSDADRQDFARWLAASPAHARSYQSVQTLWSDLGPAAGTLDLREAGDLAGPIERIRELRRKRRLAGGAAGVVLGVAAVVAGAWLWLEQPHLIENWQADLATARGEQRQVALADGSTLILDADSAVNIDFSSSQRRVTLLRGAAFFAVEPAQTPFVVTARNGAARVLGTAFEVASREGDEVTVTLERGSLQVGLLDRSNEVVLKPGESVEYGKAGLGTAHAVDPDETAAWRGGRFIFTNVRLADVLQRIGRYREGRIVLIDSDLGDRRVSGNVALRDTDAALAAVQSSVGFRLTRLGRITVVSP